MKTYQKIVLVFILSSVSCLFTIGANAAEVLYKCPIGQPDWRTIAGKNTDLDYWRAYAIVANSKVDCLVSHSGQTGCTADGGPSRRTSPVDSTPEVTVTAQKIECKYKLIDTTKPHNRQPGNSFVTLSLWLDESIRGCVVNGDHVSCQTN